MKKQLEIKKIAIWMDHKEAKMIDPAHLDQDLIKVTSKIKGRKRISGQSSDGVKLGGFRSSNNEFAKHEKEQNSLHAYFKELADKLVVYDEILIFGPTTARQEFYNYLNAEHNFINKVIHTVDGDYITDNQLKAFVKKSLVS
ncbi:MAG: hypothetical protein KBF42_00870 [Chitinophagales bacterium]|jgi:stalled ribosome rescue protein Dom34|nr:hypothetical protein [Bacteroidota bacterium]MBK7569361.1 hypothetical protein [Bacteroidota bacterium]MBP8915267.1 hypothetical protein [Chitinophagales bacterium]MBP9219908.1 hypothetical protein [Chitinophagales bacterium]MBP9795078.1 hypothetical protein [Chitinophagales bacterium]